MSFQVGERIGDYQVVDILGAGGMGKVYKVKNVFSERIEAMKVLLPNLSSDPELADRFIREIKVQASLEHTNIAGLRTAQQVNNQLLMIVEFVDGSSLEQLMRQGPVPMGTAVECVSQVLSALAYAHANGIIHRDIKPGNIMVARSGVVKLMDFGIAKAVADRKLTQTGRTVGSLYYMSPEQIQGSASLDGRADLYSLGVTLYELVTGRRPFQGDSDYSIMAAHLSQVPVPPVQLDPKVPAALNEVILQSIAKDPAQRFQSAEAFKNALDSVARELSAPAGVTAPLPASAAPPVQQGLVAAEANVTPGSSKRALYMVAGSLATLLVLGAAAFHLPRYFGTEAGETKPVPQVQTAQQLQAAPEQPGSEQPAPMSDSANSAPEQQPLLPKTLIPTGTSRQQALPGAGKPDTGTPRLETPSPAQPPVQTAQSNPAPIQNPVADQPPTPTPPARSTVNAVELEKLADRFNLMATRANTVRTGLKRLEESQARMGLGLRGDVTTAASRMAMFMDQAEAALKGADMAGSGKAMDSAERELERVEKVLEGR